MVSMCILNMWACRVGNGGRFGENGIYGTLVLTEIRVVKVAELSISVLNVQSWVRILADPFFCVFSTNTF